MLSCLKTRSGEIHIINWTTFRGTHYTLCGKSFSNKDYVETFGADNTFPDMCTNCYEIQESTNQAVMDYAIRDFRHSHVLDHNFGSYQGIQKGWHGVETQYDDMAMRYWSKSARLRRKFPSEETRPSKKRRKYKKLHGKSSIFLKRK